MPSKSLTYMPALDGLRALAVALVFLAHAYPDSPFPGGLGVDVFFVISGFLITKILVKELERSESVGLQRFYIKRAARLWPPLIVTVVTFGLISVLAGVGSFRTFGASAVALTYTSNVVMTVTGAGLGPLSHTWSLAMEEQFYLVWPPVLLYLWRRGWTRTHLAAFTLALAAISLTGWVLTAESLPYNPLTKAGGLLLGCALALLMSHRPWRSAALAYLGLGGCTLAVLAESYGAVDRNLTMPVVSLAVVPVIAYLSTGDSGLARALSLKPLVYLGVISYEVYLIHFPLFWLVERAGGVAPATAAVAVAVATLVLAALTRRWVSAPILAWRDREDVAQRALAR